MKKSKRIVYRSISGRSTSINSAIVKHGSAFSQSGKSGKTRSLHPYITWSNSGRWFRRSGDIGFIFSGPIFHK